VIGDDLTEKMISSLKEEIKRDYPGVSLELLSWNTEKGRIEKVDKKDIIL